jgi:hypothetical protein
MNHIAVNAGVVCATVAGLIRARFFCGPTARLGLRPLNFCFSDKAPRGFAGASEPQRLCAMSKNCVSTSFLPTLRSIWKNFRHVDPLAELFRELHES